jgi:dynein heavy chain
MDKNDPEGYPIPDFHERILGEKEIGSLLSVCLVRSMREDRTLVSCSQFIQ